MTALFLVLGLTTATAAPPAFDLPVACEPGRTCFIQNFFDRDAGPAWRDHACGFLSYDGHVGTDFRVADLKAMQAGVPVLAAAAGTVIGVRDGEPDVSIRQRPHRPGRAAGNGVGLNHGDGWVTQYSHLKNGSIRVQVGQQVVAGQMLGLIGLSGNTEFPHLDFAVRKDNQPIDPFSPDGAESCGAATATLWSANTAQALRYQASGLLSGGFSAQAPTEERLMAGDFFVQTLPVDAPAILFSVQVFGARELDVERLEVSTPAGAVLVFSEKAVTRTQATRFSYIGQRRKTALWDAGKYVGRYRLQRNGQTVVEFSSPLQVGAISPAPP